MHRRIVSASSSEDRSPETPAPTALSCSPGKITPPNVADVAPNVRLSGRLDMALARPIVWLYGPPGAGKTTLVARYFADKGIDPIWLRLDAADTDPATLFFHAGLAQARTDPAGAIRLPVVRPEYFRNLGAFGRRFFRALFDRADRTVLVLDDYQDVDHASAIHACLAESLKEIAPHARVVVLSRAPPPKDFARLRSHGTIDVVPPHALCLSLDEASSVARGRALAIPPATMARLVERTDGWMAGLILLMEAAQVGAPDLGNRVESVPELLFDDLARDMFARMDERSQRILMTLAILPNMSGPDAALFAEDETAIALLEDLARRNYFITRDRDSETNYRFHPLFRGFLLTQARAAFDDAKRARFGLRAAKVLERSGDVEAAVPFYEDAGAWDDLIRIIGVWASPLVENGRHATLLAWLEHLPSARVDADGWLTFWMATARFAVSPAQSRPLFRNAFALFEVGKDRTGLLLAWAGLARSIADDPSSNQAELDSVIALLRELMPSVPAFPSPAVELRVALAMYLALVRRSADRVELRLWRDRALAAAAGEPGRVTLIRNYIALYALIDGDHATFRDQFASIPPADALGQEPLLQALAYVTLGLAQLFGQMPGRCEDTAERALVASRDSGIYFFSHVLAGFEAIAESDLTRSRTWLRRTAHVAGNVAVYHSAHDEMLAAGIALLAGDIEGALRSARLAVDMAVADGWIVYEAMSRVSLAEALDFAGRFDEADAELIAAEAAAARVAFLSLKISTDFLRADFLLRRGRESEGLAALRIAMDAGEQAGGRRTMLTPSRTSRLCARAIAENIQTDYARLLIQVSTPPPHDQAQHR